MQMFGLLSLLITIALAAWWLTTMGPVAGTENEDGTSNSSYSEALDDARGAADALER